MHGVRRAEVQLGDTAMVIGLGLIGQLVVRLLVASGVRVIGLDMIEERCRMAEQAGAVLRAAPTMRAWLPSSNRSARSPAAAGAMTCSCRGRFFNAPVETAARLARDRARVIESGRPGWTYPGMRITKRS